MRAIPRGPLQCKRDERSFGRIDVGAGIRYNDLEERFIRFTNDDSRVRMLTRPYGFHGPSSGQAPYREAKLFERRDSGALRLFHSTARRDARTI